MTVLAVGIADLRRLDLDHARAEIAKDRGRGRTGDKTRAIEHQKIAEQSFGHDASPCCGDIRAQCALYVRHAHAFPPPSRSDGGGNR